MNKLDKLKKHLKHPFPALETNKQKGSIAFVFATTIYLFLLVFQPFHISHMKEFMPISIYLLGYWVNIFFTFLLYDFVLTKLKPQYYHPDNWNLGKMLLKVFLIILTCAILGFAYQLPLTMIYQPEKTVTIIKLIRWFSLMLFFTITVASLPTMILILVLERFLQIKNQNIAQNVTDEIHNYSQTKPGTSITISSKSKNEKLTIDPKQLICIKSDNIYVDVFYYNNAEIVTKLIRTTLNSIEENIQSESIKRCHRSYIVNLQNVKLAKGNSKGLLLEVEKLGFDIPVSRTFPKEIIEQNIG